MRRPINNILLACALLVAAWPSDAGQREEIDRRSLTTAVSKLTAGDRLAVKETSGTLWFGEFQSFEYGTSVLVLSDAVTADGTVAEGALEIRERSIEYVALETKRARYRGALIGLGVGVAAAALAAQGCCGNPDYGPETMFAILGPILGGAGAGIGYALDKGRTDSEVIYTADPPPASSRWWVSPIVTRNAKGAAVTFSF